MGFSIFVFLTLLTLAYSNPEPDPNVQVGVDVQVYDQGGNCCCGNCKKSCLFGNEVYPDKCCLKTTCMKFCCNDGQWEYNKDELITETCGNCTFGGEPQIYTFDPVDGQTPPYTTLVEGEYVMTQPGFKKNALFGVHAHFKFLSDVCNTCENGVTYFETGITVSMFLPVTAILNSDCTTIATATSNPQCAIRVFVNNKEHKIGSTVTPFSGTQGSILVFKHDNGGYGSVNCINVVGTYGLNVIVCERFVGVGDGLLPWTYIYASPSLLSPPPATPPYNPFGLYGLCNTYTGQSQPSPAYIGRNKLRYATVSFGGTGPYVNSWKYP